MALLHGLVRAIKEVALLLSVCIRHIGKKEMLLGFCPFLGGCLLMWSSLLPTAPPVPREGGFCLLSPFFFTGRNKDQRVIFKGFPASCKLRVLSGFSFQISNNWYFLLLPVSQVL